VTVANDRLVAVFDGPSRAIRCAQAIVDQCAALDVRVRAGLHTGECVLLDGEPHGLPLRTAAWAMSQANAGEVMASSTVRDLVSGSGIV
jgi:class 3 adenylate cyclase